MENLGKFGLKIDAFGSNSVIVREIPALVSDCNVKNLVDAVINDLANENSLNYLETEVNKICSTIACHGSIRSGRKLEVENEQLIKKMENTKNSGQCNHGRPTFIKLNILEIEKLFGRKISYIFFTKRNFDFDIFFVFIISKESKFKSVIFSPNSKYAKRIFFIKKFIFSIINSSEYF